MLRYYPYYVLLFVDVIGICVASSLNNINVPLHKMLREIQIFDLYVS